MDFGAPGDDLLHELRKAGHGHAVNGSRDALLHEEGGIANEQDLGGEACLECAVGNKILRSNGVQG